VLSGLGEGPEPGLLCSGRRKLIEDAAGKGGREAPARNLMPQAGHKLADVSWDFRRERRKRGHRHRLFIAEAGEHAMERGSERVQILPFRRSTIFGRDALGTLRGAADFSTDSVANGSPWIAPHKAWAMFPVTATCWAGLSYY